MNNDNNIENNGLNKHIPFNTGSDYFENFVSKINDRVDGYEEIKTIAPFLSNIPKYNPFEVPLGYFDELPATVQQRCTENKVSTSILEWLSLLIKPRFAVPVLATLFIAVAGIDFMNKSAVSYEPAIAEEYTVEEQLYTIDEATIIETLIADAGTDPSADDNSIEDYLIDNDIDESNLNNEL